MGIRRYLEALGSSPNQIASGRFADNVVRTARLLPAVEPWYCKFFSPILLAGFAAAIAVVSIAILSLKAPDTVIEPQVAKVESTEAVAIQEIAETETLLAAVDQLDDFSDTELVTLIGF